ncbi:MAG: DUF3841 domain-containing protein [Neomegalonema sp.]|nr:DUF3841 domain-containing protein [Neomegalonema sp.]
MKIWTVQSAAAWRELRRNARLIARREHQTADFRAAYDWMRAQMLERIGPPANAGAQPLWGWAKCGAQARSLSADELSCGYAPGEHVVIQADIPENALLLSDFEAWHCVLNGTFLARNGAENDAFEKRGQLARDDAGLQREIKHSWARVFDMPQLCAAFWGPAELRWIQACFWVLEERRILSATPVSIASPQPI